MAKHRIFTVGFDLPGEDFEYINFESDQTLLDADIVLFTPTLGEYQSLEYYNGKQLLSDRSSFQTKKYIDHWRSEIISAAEAGKIVIVYLVRPNECFRYTGEKQFSGTGRSRHTTKMVDRISSYDAVPCIRAVTSKSGTKMRLTADAIYLKSYWNDFSDYHKYEVEIEGDFTKTLIQSHVGERIVGAVTNTRAGVILFMPALQYDEDLFITEDESITTEDDSNGGSIWTEEALRFGKRFVSALVNISNTLKKTITSTPPPDWTLRPEYRLSRENNLEIAIAKYASEIAKLNIKKDNLEDELQSVGNLRGLLFEQGRQLEEAILEALRIMGFIAEEFSDNESQFDVVFRSAEGRCLGEAEGKDDKPININKFSQLERNIQEDFTKDGVTEYANGVLFGNAFRLKPLNERDEFFTTKCMLAAKRIGATLIRTPDLFVVAKYLSENPTDSGFASECRATIFRAKGEIATFPPPPIEQEVAIVENVGRKNGET